MLRLFIAEGDNNVRAAVRNAVEQNIREVEIAGEASSGIDAINLIEILKPDIIICDVHLAKLGGLEILSRLNDSAFCGAVIMLSRAKDFYAIERSMDYGALAFLTKPLNEAKLIEKLRLAAKRVIINRKIEELERPLKAAEGIEQLGRRKLVLDALKLIADYYNTPLKIKWAAERLYVSESHLMHIFKQDMGKTFNQYLTEYRIAVAKKLMAKNRYKIYEIAAMVGFSDSKYFGQVFKKELGKTPSKFKNE